MTDAFGTPLTPVDPPKKSNTTVIIVAVVVGVLLLCCCCMMISGAWVFGDAIMQELGVMY